MPNPFLDDSSDAKSKNPFLDDAKEASASPSAPDQLGFFSRILGDFSKRAGQEGGELLKQATGQQKFGETALNTLGAGAGLAGDIGGEVAKISWNATPDMVKQPIVDTGKAILNTDIGKSGVAAVKQGMDSYGNWAKENPRTSHAIDSVANIATMAPGVKGVAKAGEAVAPIAKGATDVVTSGIGKAVAPIAPKIDPGLLPVVNLAKKYKIPLSMDEVTGSRALKAVQKAGQDLPFSGQQGFRDKQMAAWNKGILETVGTKGERITPEVMKERFSTIGKKFDALGAGKTFNIKGGFQKGIQDIVNEAQGTTTKDAIANLKHSVNDIIKNADKGGNIAGEKLGEIRKKINKRMRETDNYDTKVLLGNLENHIIDQMTADPKVAKDFSKTKQQYKNLIVLEPLVQKGKAGNISPTGLRNRVARLYGRAYTTGQAGDIGELARVGGELLPELGGSDTQTKAVYTGLAGGGALTHPVATGAVLGGNRLFQNFINRNQSLIHNLAGQQ